MVGMIKYIRQGKQSVCRCACLCVAVKGWGMEGYIYQVGPQGGHRLGRGGARTALVLQTVLALALLVQARDRASPGQPTGGGGPCLTVGKTTSR